MSIEALNWAWSQGEITPIEKLVLISLASYTNQNFQSSLSFAALQTKTNLGRTAVVDALNRLETKKLIVKLGLSSPRSPGPVSRLYQLGVQKGE